MVGCLCHLLMIMYVFLAQGHRYIASAVWSNTQQYHPSEEEN
jgi:hypothetical protein